MKKIVSFITIMMMGMSIAVCGEAKDYLDVLEETVENDVENTIDSLTQSYEELQTEIDTYEKYKANLERVESFYDDVVATQQELTIRLREYALAYAEEILASDSDDKYKDLKEIYDVVYDDAGDDVYDEIYGGILKDMLDVYYGGILKDVYDTSVDYSEWSDLRSDEYDWWSDARSDAYDDWSDLRSDVYDFWSDMRSAMWDDDIEDAQEEMEDLKEDIDDLWEDIGKTSGNTEIVLQEESAYDNDSVELVDGMRPEFKEAMDSYEAFYDEYCDFMKKYQENPTDISLLTEYADMAKALVDMDEKFEAWKSDDLNSEELKYYIDVSGRISKKLLELVS